MDTFLNLQSTSPSFNPKCAFSTCQALRSILNETLSLNKSALITLKSLKLLKSEELNWTFISQPSSQTILQGDAPQMIFSGNNLKVLTHLNKVSKSIARKPTNQPTRRSILETKFNLMRFPWKLKIKSISGWSAVFKIAHYWMKHCLSTSQR